MPDENQAAQGELNFTARVYPIAEPRGNLLAFASMNINGQFAVTGLRVLNSKNGLFVAMPQAKDSKGGYRDVCFPSTPELYEKLQATVLNAYSVALEQAPQDRESTVDKLREGAQTQPETAAKSSKAKSKPATER